MTEPAWEGAGTEVGLKIWRIVVSGMSQNQSPLNQSLRAQDLLPEYLVI